MDINLSFLPHWPPLGLVSTRAGITAIMTISFYSLLFGIAGIAATTVFCLPIYALYRLSDWWNTRREDEADVGSAGNPNRRTPESDEEDEEDSEWVLEPRWVRRAITV